jgi:hypothetical protein
MFYLQQESKSSVDRNSILEDIVMKVLNSQSTNSWLPFYTFSSQAVILVLFLSLSFITLSVCLMKNSSSCHEKKQAHSKSVVQLGVRNLELNEKLLNN